MYIGAVANPSLMLDDCERELGEDTRKAGQKSAVQWWTNQAPETRRRCVDEQSRRVKESCGACICFRGTSALPSFACHQGHDTYLNMTCTTWLQGDSGKSSKSSKRS